MKNSNSRSIAGIILILFGGLWFLSKLHITYFDVWDYFWPGVFVTIGIVLAVKGKALFLATLFIFFGGLNLLSNFFDISFNSLFDDFWPLILVALGLLILFRKKDKSRCIKDQCFDDKSTGNPFYSNGNEPPANANQDVKDPQAPEDEKGKTIFSYQDSDSKVRWDSKGFYYKDTDSTFYSSNGQTYYKENKGSSSEYWNSFDADRIDEVAILTSCRKYVTSQSFKGGKITAILGGGIIDFTGARLAEGENIIEYNSILGGVTFRVPQDWKIIVNVHSVFGGFEDKRRYFNSTEPQTGAVLVIKGTVVFGGGTITFNY